MNASFLWKSGPSRLLLLLAAQLLLLNLVLGATSKQAAAAEEALLWSTFLGASDQPDEAWGVAVDATGVYIAGQTWAGDFPATPGAFDDTHNGTQDAFVAKLSKDGKTLIWATFLGGSGYDWARGVAVDGSGVYVVGDTASDDFPTSAGAYSRSHRGGHTDLFAAKLALDGGKLLWSTYLGGSKPGVVNTGDYAFDLAVHNQDVFLCGRTDSPDFPTTPGAFDATYDGKSDGFVSKIKKDGSALIFSTYLGRSENDYCHALAVDQSGHAYVTGRTYSSDFPTTAGAYDTTHNGQHDAYIAKFSEDGQRLVYSTFLGGEDWDIGLDIVERNGYLTLSGATKSADFPTSAGAYDRTHAGLNDVFVARLNTDGTKLLASTLIGGEDEDRGSGVALDDYGNIHVSGDTISKRFPTTEGAFARALRGSWDGFLARLPNSLDSLEFSSYLGGSAWDTALDLAIGPQNDVFVAGWTDSADFPATMGAFDTRFGPYRDGFVTKVEGLMPDLAITALEVTQGIQNLGNDIPLVAGRGTFARAYLKQTAGGYGDVGGVTAELRAYRDDKELEGSPLSAGPIVAKSDGGDRLKPNESFLFLIPKAWRSGPVQLTVQVNPSATGRIRESNYQNNTLTENVTFHEVTTPCYIFVPIYLQDTTGQEITYRATDPSFAKVLRGLHRYHPIPNEINWYVSETLYPFAHSAGSNYDLTSSRDRHSLLLKIVRTSIWTDDPHDNCHFIGMVAPEANTRDADGEHLGLSRVGHTQSWVKMQDLSEVNVWFQRGAQTMGHELGHNKGLKHVDCGAGEDDPDNKYPWRGVNCALADTDGEGYYGFTVFYQTWGFDQTVISNDPQASALHRAFPMMSYRAPMWVSPWEYCKLLDTAYGVECNLWSWAAQAGLQRRTHPAPLTLPDSGEPASLDDAASYLIVSGWVDSGLGRGEILEITEIAELTPGMRREAIRTLAGRTASATTDAAPFTLVQVNRAGSDLRAQQITLVEDDEWDSRYYFLEFLPRAADVASLEMRQSGAVLAKRKASAQPPEVRLLAPNSGQLGPGSTIAWEGSDADGDVLTYTVLFSADNGRTWKPLAMDLAGMRWTLTSPTGVRETEQGRIKIVVHDGWHTAEDISDSPLNVPNTPPLVVIASPADGAEFSTRETVIFEALATDNEDGPNEGTMRWSSDVDGILGAGREIEAGNLSPGKHHITLLVEDSGGAANTSATMLTIRRVSGEVFLPAVARP